MWEGLALTRSAFLKQVKQDENSTELCQDWRDKWEGTGAQSGQHRIGDEPEEHDCLLLASTALQPCPHGKDVKQLLSQVWSVSGVSDPFLQSWWLWSQLTEPGTLAVSLSIVIRCGKWKRWALISCWLWEEGSVSAFLLQQNSETEFFG